MGKRKHKIEWGTLLLCTIFFIMSISFKNASFPVLFVKAETQIKSEKLVIRDSEKEYRENIGVDIDKTLQTCYVVFTPANTTNQQVLVSVSNPEIASAATRIEGGVTYIDITGIAEGVTVLTATAADGASTYQCYVTVRTPIEESEGELTEAIYLKKTAQDSAAPFSTQCSQGQRGRIKGSVGNYYYFDCPAGVLEKNYHVAYVPKEKVKIYANRVTLDQEQLTLNRGEKQKLTASIYPSVTTDQTVSYTTSDPSVVKIGANGTLKAKKKGTAKITCTTKSKYMGKEVERSAQCSVTVCQPLKKILLKPSRITLNKGKSKKIKVMIRPTDADSAELTFSSADPSVATVDKNGKITAQAEGQTTITVLHAASGKKKRCKVTVTDWDAYELIGETNMEIGSTYTLQVVKKDNISKKTLGGQNVLPISANWVYSCDHPAIAKVDKKTGVVTPLREGTVTFKARDKRTNTVLSIRTFTFRLSKAEKELLGKVKRNMIIEKGKQRRVVGDSCPQTKNMSFSSSNSKIAAVGLDGMITGKKEGVCTVTAKIKYKKIKVKVYVYQNSTGHAMAKCKTDMEYENGYQSARYSLESNDKAEIKGEVGDYWFVETAKTQSNKRRGIVKKKDLLFYNRKENRDYFARMRAGEFNNLRYENEKEDGNYYDMSDNAAIQTVVVNDTIHFYINVCYVEGRNTIFEVKNANNPTVLRADENGETYREVFERGVTNIWGNNGGYFKGKEVKVSNGKVEKDFEKGVQFRVKIHFVEVKQHSVKTHVNIYLDNTKKNENEEYWYRLTYDPDTNKKKIQKKNWVYVYSIYYLNDRTRNLYFPPNGEIIQNEKNTTVLEKIDYEKTAAHEMGHVLGLTDGYYDAGKGVNGSGIRTDIRLYNNYYNRAAIMANQLDVNDSVTENDIEMVLYAQSYGRKLSEQKKRKSSRRGVQYFANVKYQLTKGKGKKEEYYVGSVSKAITSVERKNYDEDK